MFSYQYSHGHAGEAYFGTASWPSLCRGMSWFSVEILSHSFSLALRLGVLG